MAMLGLTAAIRRPVAARADSGGCEPESAAVVRPSYELPRLDAKPDGETFQIVDRDVSQASLDAADVRAIDLAEIGKRILTEFLLDAEPPEIDCKDLSDRAWVRSFHTRIERDCGR